MNWRQLLVDVFGDVSKLSFLAISGFILFGYSFKSYILLHSSLRKLVEYFGNVSPSDDSPKAKPKASRSARVTP